MEHDGKKLKAIAKEQGFDIQSLADKLEVTRLTVENDFKAEKLSRRILKKYVSVLAIDLDGFYSGVTAKISSNEASAIIQLQRELIEEQRKRLDLQDTMLRFFPSAAQMV